MRMNNKLSALLVRAALVSALVCGPALLSSQPSAAGQDRNSGAKQDMKDAGHETKVAAKDAGHGVEKGTRKAYHKTKRGTKKAWHKTKNTTEGAANGAKEGARKPE